MEKYIETSEGPVTLSEATSELREEISRVRAVVEAAIKEAESLLVGGTSHAALSAAASLAEAALHGLVAGGSLVAALHSKE